MEFATTIINIVTGKIIADIIMDIIIMDIIITDIIITDIIIMGIIIMDIIIAQLQRKIHRNKQVQKKKIKLTQRETLAKLQFAHRNNGSLIGQRPQLKLRRSLTER